MVRALAGDSTITSRLPSPPPWFAARLAAARLEVGRAAFRPVPPAVAAVCLVAPLRAGTLFTTSHPRRGLPGPGYRDGRVSFQHARPCRYFSNPLCGLRCSPPRPGSAIRLVRPLVKGDTRGQPDRSGFLAAPG